MNYTINDDDVAEELHEQFQVMFTIPYEAEARLVIVTNASSTVTIVDNDGECEAMSCKYSFHGNQ